MPDVQEVFRMATTKIRPEPDALDRQRKAQRRHDRNQRFAALAIVVALVIAGIVLTAVTRNNANHTQIPANSPTPGLTTAPAESAVIVGLDGTTLSSVPGLPADAFALTLSPDGSELAYVTASHEAGFCGACVPGPRIVVARLDGSGAHYVTGPFPRMSGELAWSPDGSQLAFSGTDSTGNTDIYVVSASNAGGEPRRLTTDRAVDEWPSWSPDGSRILYDNSGATPPDASGFSPTAELWTIPVNGGTPTRLTHNDVPDEMASYSPDGSSIAMFRDGGIWVMASNGSNAHAVGTQGGFRPEWSPDGSRIAFLVYDGSWRPTLDLGDFRGDWPVLTVWITDRSGSAHALAGVQVATHWNAPQWFDNGDSLLVLEVRRP